METIKIGRTEFNADALREMTLDEAKLKFAQLDARIVTEAWKQANPKSKKKAPKKAPKKEAKKDD
jgi:hypothetical protein